jgi:hypothetical protein
MTIDATQPPEQQPQQQAPPPTLFQRLTETKSKRETYLLFAVLFSIAFGAFVGIMTVWHLPGIAASLQAVSFAAALWSLYELALGKWHVIRDFVKDNKTEGIRDPLAKLCVLATGLVLPIAPEAIGIVMSSERNLTIVSTLVHPDGEESVLRDRILVPFLGVQVTGCTVEDVRTRATDLKGLAAVERIACGLRRCIASNKDILVDVRGFASDKQFQCGTQQSDMLNLAIAEARRERVIEALDNARCDGLSTGKVLYVNEGQSRWNNDIAAMRAARDTDSVGIAGTESAVESMARRAEIVIESAGGCDLKQR